MGCNKQLAEQKASLTLIVFSPLPPNNELLVYYWFHAVRNCVCQKGIVEGGSRSVRCDL